MQQNFIKTSVKFPKPEALACCFPWIPRFNFWQEGLQKIESIRFRRKHQILELKRSFEKIIDFYIKLGGSNQREGKVFITTFNCIFIEIKEDLLSSPSNVSDAQTSRPHVFSYIHSSFKHKPHVGLFEFV